MIRVVIVDDERPPRERIRALLAAQPGEGLEVVGEAVDGSSAIEEITALRPDLVFLDVQLPGMTGPAILDALGKAAPPAVVFVTAYDRHAIEAFDRHAVDYLLKPIAPARFATAVERARIRLESHRASLPLSRPIERWFSSRVGSEVTLVPESDVEWIEGAGNYVRLHTARGRFPIRATISGLATALDATRFLRVHRSTIVRIDAIWRIRAEGDGEYSITMRTGIELRSSRRYGAAVRRLSRETPG